MAGARRKWLACGLLLGLAALLAGAAMQYRALRQPPAQTGAPTPDVGTWRAVIQASGAPAQTVMKRYHLSERDLDRRVKVRAKTRRQRLAPMRTFEAAFPLRAGDPEAPQRP